LRRTTRSVNEDDARAQIVRYAARLWNRRLVTGTSGNVSVRLENGDVLVTPARRALAELEPLDVVRVDARGRAYDDSRHPSSELPLHLAAYAARGDARCVVHAHPTFCVVWSLWGQLFPQETVGARETLGPVAWTPYRPTGTAELAEVCRDAFSRGFNTVLMERHGLSSVGPDLEVAFLLADQAEEAARVAYYASLRAVGSGKNTEVSERGGPL